MKHVKLTLLAVTLLLATSLTLGQTSVEVAEAQLSIPFGVVDGKVVLVGDYLVFVDEDSPENSFALMRDSIQDLRDDGRGALTLMVSEPVRDRTGERNQMTLRLRSDGAVDSLMQWSERAGERRPTQAGGQPDQREEGAGEIIATYDAKHDHGIFGGSCRGQLMVRPNILVYDSVDNISHSRQWELREIKELELENPYELEVNVFTGSDYTLEFIGNSMDNRTFNNLVERLTRSRVSR